MIVLPQVVSESKVTATWEDDHMLCPGTFGPFAVVSGVGRWVVTAAAWMEIDVSKDVKLTEEERRILADIERYEGELRTQVPWAQLRARAGRGDGWAWGAVLIGVAVLVAGFAANLGLVPFAGFLLLLAGATRLSERVTFGRWRTRLRAARHNLSAPRSGQDGT